MGGTRGEGWENVEGDWTARNTTLAVWRRTHSDDIPSRESSLKLVAESES